MNNKFYLIILVILLISSCQNTQEASPVNDRYVYYSLNDLGAGVYCYSIPSGKTVQLYDYSIPYISTPSKNNQMFFECYCTKGYIKFKYSNGDMNVVPDPGTFDEKFSFVKEPKVNPYLDYSGNNIYIMHKQLKKNSTIPEITDTIPLLSVFNIEKWQYSLISLENFASEQFKLANKFYSCGKNLISNNIGTKVFFVLNGVKKNLDSSVSLGYIICEFSDSKLKCRTSILPDEPILLAYDNISDKLVYQVKTKINLLSTSGGIEVLLGDYNSTLDPKQFAIEKQEVVLWNNDGIGIYSLNNFELVSQVITFQDIQSKYDVILKVDPLNHLLSISPEAEQIAFGLFSSTIKQDLFIVERDGSSLNRILQNQTIEHISVSPNYISK